jgi:urease accessory protein
MAVAIWPTTTHTKTRPNRPRSIIMSAETHVLTTLLAWFSPAFPVGAFAFSHGLEKATAEGLVVGEEGLAGWIDALLTAGGAWTDAVLFAAAYRAAQAQTWVDLSQIAALASALAPSAERLRETLAQGDAFARAIADGWPSLLPLPLGAVIAYPVVAGAAVAALKAPLSDALVAYLNAFAGNAIAVGIRLGLCGQSGGVRILSSLGQAIAGAAQQAALSNLDDLGACAFGADIASMRHETLQPRIFVS